MGMASRLLRYLENVSTPLVTRDLFPLLTRPDRLGHRETSRVDASDQELRRRIDV